MKPRNEGVQKAIEAAGGTYESLAVKLGCSTQAVRKMLLKNCTGERAVQIEEVTEGAVKREEIRPDLFIKNYKPVSHPGIPVPASMRAEFEGVEKLLEAPPEESAGDEIEIIDPLQFPKDPHHDTENLRHRAAVHGISKHTPAKEQSKADIARPGRRTLRVPVSVPTPALPMGAVKTKN